MQLSELTHPNQLRGLSTGELEDVARQIRERHLEVVSISGGHLGPGLGVVELTVALHSVLLIFYTELHIHSRLFCFTICIERTFILSNLISL